MHGGFNPGLTRIWNLPLTSRNGTRDIACPFTYKPQLTVSPGVPRSQSL